MAEKICANLSREKTFQEDNIDCGGFKINATATAEFLSLEPVGSKDNEDTSSQVSRSFRVLIDCVRWLICALMPKDQEEGSFRTNVTSVGKARTYIIAFKSFKPRETHCYCWTKMFSSACIIDLALGEEEPSNMMDTLANEASSEPGGLKVGFEPMLELSGIERIMEYEGGLVLSGLDTALVPLPASDWPDYFRWHLSRTPGKRIKVPEVIQNIGPKGWDKVNNLEKFSGHVVYVDWVVESTVLLGTCHSAAAPDLRGSSVEAVKQVKSKSEDAAVVQLQGKIPHGPTIAGQFQRTYLYGPTVRPNDKVAQFGQSLDGPKSRRVILYDDETKKCNFGTGTCPSGFCHTRVHKSKWVLSFQSASESGPMDTHPKLDFAFGML